MRPILLELNAFGPFAGQEIVDFETIASAGIFLISGPTGAGKTTIFDGICFALYGEASGALRQNEDFKSDFADPSAVCSVRYVFSVRDEHFEIQRWPKQQKQKKNGGFTTVSAKAELILPDGSVLTGPATVSARVQEILGLNARQFKQITMLAQGDFRRFLDAPSKEKQDIFRHLFDTEKFDRFTSFLEAKTKESLQGIEQQRQMVSFHLKSLSPRKDSLLQELLAPEFPLVPQVLERLDILHAQEKERLVEKESALAQLEKQRDALQIEARRKDNQRLEQLELLRKKAFEEKAREPQIQKQKAVLSQMKKAVQLLPLWEKIQETGEEHTALSESLRRKKEERKELDIVIRQWEESVEKAAREEEKTPVLQRRSAQWQTLLPLYQERQDLSMQLSRLKEEAAAAQKEEAYLREKTIYFAEEQALSILEKQQKACDGLVKVIRERMRLIKLFQAQKEIYQQNYELFFNAQAGILASKLQPDSPCPVCGSTHHPHPAALRSDPPTQEQLRIYHDAADQTSQKIAHTGEQIAAYCRDESLAPFLENFEEYPTTRQEAAALQAFAEIEKRFQAKSEELSARKHALRKMEQQLAAVPPCKNAEQAQKFLEQNLRRLQSAQSVSSIQQRRLDELTQKLPQDIPTRQALHQKIQETEKSIETLRQNLKSTRENLQKSLSQRQLLEQSAVDGRKRLDELEKRESQLKDDFFHRMEKAFPGGQDEFIDVLTRIREIEPLERQLQQYELSITNLAGQITQLEAQCKDVKPIDITLLLEREKSYLEAISALREETAAIRLSLETDQAHAQKARQIHATIEKEEANYRRLNDLFRVANGNNPKRVDFETYVLGFYFDAIIAFSNRRLENLTGGRYQLRHKQDREKFGRSSGLDLEILDQYSGKVRPTSTLSGGESFKTALALSLSLADVVQMHAGGVVIDTMFIDEGFGSLDSSSLDNAIEALLSLSSDGRLVGIISHISQLKERIPTQIQVLSGRTGSTIERKAL